MLLFTFCLEIYLCCIKIALIAPLSQSLTGAINQAKRTVKVKRPTLLLQKFAGACEVINWRGSGGGWGVEPTISLPFGVICSVVSDIKIISRNKVELSSK